jgi:hypothetical protein
MKLNRRLAQLFKRAGSEIEIGKRIENTPEDYKQGFYDGFVQGRDAQRKADIEVGKRLITLPNPEQGEIGGME